MITTTPRCQIVVLFRCIINEISKIEAMGLLNDANLNEKSGALQDITIHYQG